MTTSIFWDYEKYAGAIFHEIFALRGIKGTWKKVEAIN